MAVLNRWPVEMSDQTNTGRWISLRIHGSRQKPFDLSNEYFQSGNKARAAADQDPHEVLTEAAMTVWYLGNFNCIICKERTSSIILSGALHLADAAEETGEDIFVTRKDGCYIDFCIQWRNLHGAY